MMEFWPENQGQSHLYSKFGTVPGRSYTQNYPDRHQAAQYPLYYGEQQDQSRDQYNYWTLPGSRTGGALHEYTNWAEPEPTAPSSHFPFILDRQTQHHQDLGAYQPHEARDREWTTAYRGTRDYERGFLREGLQRRWEPCSPIRYNREVSAKRTDSSSYRELEAWAARYSHSLPRRRRIEAELRGASQGLGDSSIRAPEKQSRSDPQVAAMHSVQHSASFRESGLWDRSARQQPPTYYPSQVPDTSHLLDTKENISYQRRTFSQPPGYIAPPPYNSPHKSSHVMHHCDAPYWDQDGKRQTCWSQPTLREQDVDTREKKKEEKETTMSDETKTHTELEGLKHQGQEADTLLQQPQVIQSSKVTQETSSKVIEGRKFRLNKKTGGMTIFCLVSRIAGTTETPSLPLCTSQTNIPSAETAEVSEGLRDTGEPSAMHKLADEVDFRPAALTAKEKETCTDETAKITAEPSASPNTSDVSSTFGRQAGQSAQPSVKYPLWKEPSFTSRAETESPSTSCLKVSTEEEESVQSHPIDIEVRRLDIKEDSEDSKGLLVIDTTCVVVKMELIPSPKKEHVHYLGTTTPTEDSPLGTPAAVSPQLNEDATTDRSARAASLDLNETPETGSDSALLEKGEHEEESETSLLCKPSHTVSERETLEERAERILGIPLHDSMTEQKPIDASSLTTCTEEQDEDTEPPLINHASKQTPEDTREDEQSQNDLDEGEAEGAMCLTESDREPGADAEGVDSAGSLEQEKNTDETDIKTSTETETAESPVVKSICEKGTDEENQTAEEDQFSQPPDICNSSISDLTSPSCVSNTEEGPDPELASLNEPENLIPHPETLPQTPSPLLPGSSDSSLISTPHSAHSPPPHFDLIYQTSEAEAHSEDEEGKTSLTDHEVGEVNDESLGPEEDVSQLHLECVQTVDAACITDADEELKRLSKQNIETPNENGLGGDMLQVDCVQAEEDLCVKEGNMTEEQIPTQANDDPAGLSVHTTETGEETEGQSEGQTEVPGCQEEDHSCIKEDEDQQMTLDEFWEQTTCTDNPADSPTEAGSLQEAEPSNSPQPSAPDCEVSPSPLEEHSELPSPPHSSPESDTTFVSCSDLICLNSGADVGVPETVPPPLHIDLCEESPQFTVSVPDLPPSSTPPPLEENLEEADFPLSSTPPPLEESLSVPADFPPSLSPEEKLQYPKSLWDVVNRIRKHTAPDSENEEEEVSELWDPETVGEDLQYPHVAQDVNSEAEQQETLKGSAELQVHGEEETRSCSSTSSRGSEHTVIVADEDDEVTETTHDPVTECKPEEEDEEATSAEGEKCCSDEVKDEITAEENEDEEQDEEDTNMSCQSEERPEGQESMTSVESDALKDQL